MKPSLKVLLLLAICSVLFTADAVVAQSRPIAFVPTGTGFVRVIGGTESSAGVKVPLADTAYVSGTLASGNGGTGYSNSGTVGNGLYADGFGSWVASKLPLNNTNYYTGILPIANGGTGTTTGAVSPPSYYPTDANDQLLYRFQNVGSATISNLGALGSSMDMTINASGLNTAVKQGVPDGWFGKGLGVAEGTNNFLRAITPPHSPGWTDLTVSVWFIPSRYAGASNFGRVFFKHYVAGTWGPPYFGTSMEYSDSPPNFHQYIVSGPSGGTQLDAVLDGDFALPLQSRIHLTVLTYNSSTGTEKGYLDGQLVNTVTGGATLNLGGGEWCIGAVLGPGFVEHFGGIISEVRVANVERDAAWVLANWQTGVGRP